MGGLVGQAGDRHLGQALLKGQFSIVGEVFSWSDHGGEVRSVFIPGESEVDLVG